MSQKSNGGEINLHHTLLKNILNRNDKSEHITHLDNVVRIIIVWSEWGDSNSRHLAPKLMSNHPTAHFVAFPSLFGGVALPLQPCSIRCFHIFLSAYGSGYGSKEIFL